MDNRTYENWRASVDEERKAREARIQNAFPPLTPQEQLDRDEWRHDEPIDLRLVGGLIVATLAFWVGLIVILFL